MTAGPAAIAAALRKSRRLSSSAMGPPIPIYPMIAAVPGGGGGDRTDSRVERAKISPLLKGCLLILKELGVRARQKRAKISPFFQILRIEFPGRSSRLPLIM